MKLKIFLSALAFTLSFSLFAQKKDEVLSQFKKDISYLASDMLQGRLSGSVEEEKSSLYIADIFKTFGLTPAGDENTYLQGFSMIRLRLSNNKNEMVLTDHFGRVYPYKVGDYYPLSQSCNVDTVLSTPVFQAGYGIEATELGHHDYAGAKDIKGKVFMIKIGSPDASNPHGKYAAYESLSYKVNLAMEKGARGVIFYNTDTLLDNPKGMLDRGVSPGKIPVLFVTGKDTSLMNMKEVSFIVNIVQLNSTAHNVLGYMNNKKKTTIVIGAHQDHLGHNEFGGSRETEGGLIHNGADDNASGVAMMLQLMRAIKKNKKLRKHNYLFVAFSGEEQGLLGSNYFVKHPTIDTSKIAFMMNFDMVGRLDSSRKALMIYGVGTSPVWDKSVASIKTDTADIHIKTTESGTGASDHTSFYFANIPVLHFFTGQHADYHKASDDEEKINYNGMYHVYDVVLQMLKSVRKVKSFPFTPTKNEETEKMSFKVTLGIMPDYIYSDPGVRVDGVSLDKPAHKAGLLKGDIITKLGDYTINTMMDYMKALGQFKKGQTTTVVVKRGDEVLSYQLTF